MRSESVFSHKFKNWTGLIHIARILLGKKLEQFQVVFQAILVTAILFCPSFNFYDIALFTVIIFTNAPHLRVIWYILIALLIVSDYLSSCLFLQITLLFILDHNRSNEINKNSTKSAAHI